MRSLACTTAQTWLQAPDELAGADARALETHLQQCEDCAGLAEIQTKTDTLIRAHLEVTAGSLSVREQVRAHLDQQPSRSRRTPVGVVYRALIRLAHSATMVTVAAAAAVILAALTPQILPGGIERVAQPAIAWHDLRANISFPIAIDPARQGHLLAGATGQVYESMDGGNSWHRLGVFPPRLDIQAVAIDASQPNRYLVATRHSVYASADGGRHWTMTLGSAPGAVNMFLRQDPHAPGTFYLGPSILWKSTDHGMTWRPAGPGYVFAPYGIQSLAVAPDGDLFTGIWGGGVAFSRDGGRSWQRRSSGLPRNVIEVALGSGTLWAATDRGLYLSADSGKSWRRAPLPRFLATSVAASGSLVLAGGKDHLYRSTDGGRTWKPATDGLPLGPYVYSLMADSYAPGQIFASLDTDGIFRSDDAGAHWTAVNSGLALDPRIGSWYPVFFLRGGALWKTDGRGTDPGVLTVDQTVKLAAPAPDGASVAYVAGEGDGWALRVVASGGSSARTLLTGSGSLPGRIAWSPYGSLLAVERHGELTVTNLQGRSVRWPVSRGERWLGWGTGGSGPALRSSGGQGLLFWDRATGEVSLRTSNGQDEQPFFSGPYPAPPLVAPDGRHIVFIRSGRLFAGAWHVPMRLVSQVGSTCRLLSWSPAGTRLLLVCGGLVEERDLQGNALARAALPGPVTWVPGSNRDLLYFRDHGLWRWSPAGSSQLLVREADPVETSAVR